ncbi:hypothetical protein AAGV28_02565 [Flavobacterium sp. FZUC8N2.13]|uniref:DUF4142 domain-containing protein n=1 Tax=Flavobacterium zubiriense TaxID=3138075 RepID=A0ABV4T7Z6_9FLAO
MMLTYCNKKTKEIEQIQEIETIDDGEKTVVNTKISEPVLTQITESNLKIVAIAQKAQEATMSNRTRTILVEIEKKHLQLKNKIRKIAKDNFIIIPNTLYDTRLIKNFIAEINTTSYLKKLENSLLMELDLYNEINLNSQNNDLKKLTEEAIPVIKKNIAIVKTEQKRLE